MSLIGAIERAGVVFVAADQISRYGEPLEVLGSQRVRLIGPLEEVAGIAPRVTAMRSAAADEVIARSSNGRAFVSPAHDACPPWPRYSPICSSVPRLRADCTATAKIAAPTATYAASSISAFQK